jgi:hypothetical protein
MPSFFEGLSRLLKGEAVYRAGEDGDGAVNKHDEPIMDPEQPASPHEAQATTERTGPPVIPQCVVDETRSRVNGQYLDVDVTIKNMSQAPVMLDKILIMGRTHELDYPLGPGKERQFISVYNGPLLTNSSYTNSEVQYRNEQDGEYYGAVHYVEFDHESDNTYTVNRLRFIPPVKHLT